MSTTNDSHDSTDSTDTVIREMLTEKTGRHFLDSGGAYGRHFEDNQDNPPWDDPRIVVGDGYAVTNVYHAMIETLSRDGDAVVPLFQDGDHVELDPYATRSMSIESAEAKFYDWATSGDRDGDSWLTCMEAWSDAVTDIGGYPDETVTVNTYNNEDSFTQTLQYVAWRTPDGVMGLVQVHGGCDVRGGYTKPRLFSFGYADLCGLVPRRVVYECETCERRNYGGYDAPVTFHPDDRRVTCNECGDDVMLR